MSAVTALSETSPIQRERLAFVDFRLYFIGSVRRADLTERFGVSPAVSTRDLTLYRELAPGNIIFHGRTKTYRISDAFIPLFDHPIERTLVALTQGFGDGLGGTDLIIPCEIPPQINRPVLNILAHLTRAIAGKNVLSVSYTSVTGGHSVREILPFALADNGLRWHVRAFDRKSSSFRDFVLSRISDPSCSSTDSAKQGESPEDDIQWNTTIDLEVVAHPDSARPEIAALDFPMKDGVMRLTARSALAGYLLRRWGVDCTSNHMLDPLAYPLWLRNHEILSGIASEVVAPGRSSVQRGAE